MSCNGVGVAPDSVVVDVLIVVMVVVLVEVLVLLLVLVLVLMLLFCWLLLMGISKENFNKIFTHKYYLDKV